MKQVLPDLHLRELAPGFQDIVHYDPAVKRAQDVSDKTRAHHELAVDIVVYRHQSDGSEKESGWWVQATAYHEASLRAD